ncbi:MAG: Hpt domain-containing protein [Nannocystaceae bacterium]
MMAPTLDEDTIAALRELADDDDPDFLDDLIEMYIQDTGASLQNVAAMSSGLGPDRDALRRIAHTLKGASRNIGALRLAEHCSALERSADTAAHHQISATVGRMRGEFEQVKSSLTAATSKNRRPDSPC